MCQSLPNARDSQTIQLTALLSPPSLWATPSIFIHGHSSTGKSFILSHILRTNQLHHVVVNCIECYSELLLYNEVLRQFSSSCSCDNRNDFVKKLKENLSTSEEAVYVVFDKAESLRVHNTNLLSTLNNLQELTSCNLCVIFVSKLPWEKFYSNIGLRDPLHVFFPDYSKDDVINVLCHHQPADVDSRFYRDYVMVVLSFFFPVCRDIRELQHLSGIYFPVYESPVCAGEVKQDEKQKLWKRLHPHLKEALYRLHPGTVPSGESPCSIPPSDVDLPFYSKFLLIASYIASFNPSNSDRRFFLKHSGRMKKSLMKKNERKSAHLRGPIVFPLDRMMAIFYSVIDGKAPPTACLFTQVTSLVTLHLLNRATHDDQIDAPKYRCSVSLDLIVRIAKTVDFDIIRYLYDFI